MYQVLVIQESLSYTKINLLADIGGYSGIFLGASIVTLYDSIVGIVKRIKSYSFRICKAEVVDN